MRTIANRILFSMTLCFLTAFYVNAQRAREGKAQTVSMVKILANPEAYNNKKVQIAGYLHFKFEDSALYFSKDHADHLISSNAFWIKYDTTVTDSLKPNDFDEKYVMIVGTFYSDQYGHMGSFAGTVIVEGIRKLKKWYK